MARIRPDGGPDKSFLAGFGADGEVHAVAIQSDGNILIGGAFDHYDTTNRARIARVLPSGKLDVSFDPGAGVGGTVYDIQVLSSGQILAAGVFTNYAGVAKNGLVRLNADGSLDATFTAPFEATAVVKEISVRPDGKIVAAGEFSLTGNNGRRNIARFNADGSLDATFSSNTLTSGANAAVNALSFCADGSLLIGGEFTTFDGRLRTRMAKLTADGFLDVSSLLVTIPQVVTNTLLTTNNFNVTSMTNINLAANPPTTNVVFGFTSNAVFVPISTNIAPATNVVTIVDTNVVVSTNAQPVQQVQSLYQFGVNGGPNDVVNEIVFGLEEVPYAGGAFTQVDSTNRNGVVKFRSCDPLKANQRIILAGRVYDLTSNLGNSWRVGHHANRNHNVSR